METAWLKRLNLPGESCCAWRMGLLLEALTRQVDAIEIPDELERGVRRDSDVASVHSSRSAVAEDLKSPAGMGISPGDGAEQILLLPPADGRERPGGAKTQSASESRFADAELFFLVFGGSAMRRGC